MTCIQIIRGLRNKEITQEVIQKNLRNVEEGKELTIPLAVLNGEFKKQYFKCKKCGKTISEGNISGYCRKCIQKSPEVKKRMKEYHKKYNQRPEVKKRRREYYQKKKEKLKARQKEYRQKNKEKLNARRRELYALKKGKEEK